MDKIKSILSPGKSQDDELLYGQGNNGTLTGEGTHFPGGTTSGTGMGNTSGVGASTGPVQGGTSTGLGSDSKATTINPATAGELGNPVSHSTSSHNPLSSNTGSTTHHTSSTHPTSTNPTAGQTIGNTGNSSQGTHFVGATTAGTEMGNTSGIGASTGAVQGGTSTGLGHRSEATTVNPATAGELGNPVATTSSKPLSSSTHSTTTGGYGSTGTSGMPGTFGNDNTSYGQRTAGDIVGSGSGSGHSSNLTSTSATAGTPQHHTGRDVALGAGAGAAGLAAGGAHHHHESERPQGANSSGVAGTTGSTGIPGTTGIAGSNSGYGTAAANSSTTSGSTYTGTTPSGATSGTYHGGPQGTAVKGPHTTTTANVLDPNLHGTPSSGLESAHVHETDNTSRIIGGGAEEADAGHSGSTSRNTAIGAGAAGAGAAGVGAAAYEHHKHDKDLTTAEKEAKREHKHELKEEKKHAHDSTTGHSSTHHAGRDTAIGAGAGVGAAGIAGHEHNKHGAAADEAAAQKANLPGPAPNTAGPHSKDWMNKLDPRVNSAGPATGTTGSLATTHTTGTDHAMKNRNAYVDPEARNNPGFVDTPEHPVGRSGLIGVSGAGLPGHDPHTNQAGTAGSTTGILDGKTGNDHSNLGSGGVPTPTATKEHHLGRDAAGVGLVGGAAYEAEKHHHNKALNEPTASSTTGASATSAYPVTGTTTGSHDPTSKDHHYGRDAAGAGAVGGAAYEAEKHHTKDKDLSEAEKEAKKDHKHEEKLEKKHEKEARHAELERVKEHKKEEKEEKKSGGGLFSFLHRDKNKKYTKEEEDEFDRQEKEHNSHKGRDAAAVGAVGAGAYETEKHHGQHASSADKPLPTAPGSTTTGTSSTLADRTGHNTSSSHATGHTTKWEGGDGPTTEYAPPGTTLGDHLHGVERNRGVSSSATEFGTGQHNKLHKDPPSSHPAAHGGVTSDGRVIEEGTGKVSKLPIYDANATSGAGTSGIGQTSSTSGTTGSSGLGHSSGTTGSSGLGHSSGPTGSSGLGHSSGTTGSSGLGHSSGNTDTTGAHVPASGEARHELVHEGQQRLDADTGVHNPSASQAGSTNY